MNIDKAFEAENGFIVETEDNTGPFFTGGSVSPIGLDLPTRTIYLQTSASSKVIIWQKFNTGLNDWRQISAEDIPFDVSSLTTDSPDLSGLSELQEVVSALGNRNFGKEYSYNETASVISSSASFIDIASISATKPAGNYRVQFSYGATNSKSNTNNETQILFNGAQVFTREQTGLNINTVGSFIANLSHVGGFLSIQLQTRRIAGNGNFINTNSKLEVWRIS